MAPAITVRLATYINTAWKIMLLSLPLLTLACSADSAIEAPTSIDLPRLSTTYSPGDLVPDGNGELYPVVAAQTRIDRFESSFANFTCEYYQAGCTIDVNAKHVGIWNNTEQIMRLTVGGVASGTKESGDWFCSRQFYSSDIYFCEEKTAENSKNFGFNACGNKAINASVEHNAWWIGFWSFGASIEILSLNIPGGRIGLVPKFSQPPTNPSTPPCPEGEGGGSEGGGGGGGGAPEECFHVYAIWSDPNTGEIVYSQYMYTYCVGGGVQ